MDILFTKCILYNNKFSLTPKCFETNGVVKRVHCFMDITESYLNLCLKCASNELLNFFIRVEFQFCFIM